MAVCRFEQAIEPLKSRPAAPSQVVCALQIPTKCRLQIPRQTGPFAPLADSPVPAKGLRQSANLVGTRASSLRRDFWRPPAVGGAWLDEGNCAGYHGLDPLRLLKTKKANAAKCPRGIRLRRLARKRVHRHEPVYALYSLPTIMGCSVDPECNVSRLVCIRFHPPP
jgi:hypothetical protein